MAVGSDDAGNATLRLALWGVGQALPNPAVLSGYLRSLMWGVAAAALGGVLLALLVVALMFGLHAYLLAEGLPATTAWAVTGALAALSGCIALLVAASHLRRSAMVTRQLGLCNDSGLASAAQLLAQGFLNGLLDEGADHVRSHAHHRRAEDAPAAHGPEVETQAAEIHPDFTPEQPQSTPPADDPYGTYQPTMDDRRT